MVRAGVVTGMPRRFVVSALVSVLERCRWMPLRRLRPPLPATVTSTAPGMGGSNVHRTAALRWLSAHNALGEGESPWPVGGSP